MGLYKLYLLLFSVAAVNHEKHAHLHYGPTKGEILNWPVFLLRSNKYRLLHDEKPFTLDKILDKTWRTREESTNTGIPSSKESNMQGFK